MKKSCQFAAREYAHRHDLTNTVINLRHCTLLHDRQAWSNDSGTDEWHSWAQHYAVNLPTSSGIGFDRSDLAVIAAMNHIGVAMEGNVWYKKGLPVVSSSRRLAI
ncbi:DNA-binding transcriptional regulator DsdC [Escherichia coli]|uniref:DNA-binding transcriptional regulator DsdC n=1 Tax=Escherichia coli TaxID=562 RepID=A0A484WZC7_ECOLX|nr:DNA-binding transcriptional regulator DsdC [Escherichia coli]